MNVNRQASRSASTRAKLVRAARFLFARKGYAAVGTEEIVRRAGVTRGALYHQFADKEELFLAVYEEVEEGLTTRVAGMLGEVSSPFEAMRAGMRAFLEACRTPEVQRIVLIDGLGLIEAVVLGAIEAGEIAPIDAGSLSHLLMGALDEAALLVVRDAAATDTVAATLERLVEGLRVAS